MVTVTPMCTFTFAIDVGTPCEHGIECAARAEHP